MMYGYENPVSSYTSHAGGVMAGRCFESFRECIAQSLAVSTLFSSSVTGSGEHSYTQSSLALILHVFNAWIT